MAYHQQAELQKIGKEGFGIIDKHFGRAKRPYGNKAIYQESEVAQMKEGMNKSNVPSSNFVAQTFRVIYRSEVKYYYYG
jgi:hypothetical protein